MVDNEHTRSISWVDPRISRGVSPIHGRGLFATKAIRAGAVVIRWHGKVLPIRELEALKTRDRYDCAALSEDSIIVFAADDPAIYGNHSCDPNLWMESETTLSARRDIQPGEELTTDYGTMSDDPAWSMPCSCASPLCRGVIRGDDWTHPDLQERYHGHFVPYLSRRFHRRRGV